VDKRYIDMLQQGFMKPRKQSRGVKRTPQEIARTISQTTGVEVWYTGKAYAVEMPGGYANYLPSAKEARQLAKAISPKGVKT